MNRTLNRTKPLIICRGELGRRCLAYVVITLVFAVGLAVPDVDGAAAPNPRGVKPVAAAELVNYPNSWALVIGINNYKRVPTLNYAVSDAKSVALAIEQLGFARDNIITLLDEEATKQRIEQALYGTLRQASREDRLFVYYAGHGVTAALPRGGEEGYLLPVDGDPADLPLTAISMEDIRRIARRIPAKHIFFAVDACYSGFAITRDVPPTRVDASYLALMTKEPAVQIITAGRKGEPVLEEEGHGLFTRRLLQGLSGLGDTDQDGIITAQELSTWLESRVVRDSQNRQHPQYSRLDGEGQFVFVLPQRVNAPSAPTVSQKLTDDVKSLADEVARLRKENALFDQEKKLQSEREALLAEKRKIEQQAALTKQSTAVPPVLAPEVKPNRPEVSNPQSDPAAQATARLSLPASSAPLPASVAIPQFRAGDEWSIRFDDGRIVTRKVRSVDDRNIIIELAADRWQYLDRDLVLRGESTPDGKNWYPLFLNQKMIDFPLSLNKTWQFRTLVDSFPSNNRFEPRTNFFRDFTFKVIGTESIQTRAGIFEAFKIEERSVETECQLNCTVLHDRHALRYWWYAPSVRFPVKIAHVSGVPWKGQDPDYEIVSFDLK